MNIEDFSNEEFGIVREAVNKRQFRPNSQSGFKVSISTKKQVVARFIKRFEYIEKIQDPFGKTIDLPVFGFDEVDFSIYNSAPQIEMLDAPASTVSTLLSELLTLLPRERRVSDVQTEPLKWLKAMSKNLDAVMIRAINLVDIPVTNSISAKLSLEGVEDVREGIPKIIGSRKHTVHKLRVDARFQGELVKIDIIADGRANTSSNLERLCPIFREALIEARTPSRNS